MTSFWLPSLNEKSEGHVKMHSFSTAVYLCVILKQILKSITLLCLTWGLGKIRSF